MKKLILLATFLPILNVFAVRGGAEVRGEEYRRPEAIHPEAVHPGEPIRHPVEQYNRDARSYEAGVNQGSAAAAGSGESQVYVVPQDGGQSQGNGQNQQ